MYLAICEIQQKDLDAVCFLLGTGKAEYNTAVFHKEFHSVAECLSSVALSAFRNEALSVFCAQRKKLASR